MIRFVQYTNAFQVSPRRAFNKVARFGEECPVTPASPVNSPPPTPTDSPDSNKQRTWLQKTGRVLLNAFHVGAALFIFAGVSFLHLPATFAIPAIVGTMLVQSAVRSMSEDEKNKVDVHDPKQMKEFAININNNFKQSVEAGGHIFKRFPMLDKLYSTVTHPICNAFEYLTHYFIEDVVPNMVTVNQIPEGSLGKKAWFLAKTVFFMVFPFLAGQVSNIPGAGPNLGGAAGRVSAAVSGLRNVADAAEVSGSRPNKENPPKIPKKKTT